MPIYLGLSKLKSGQTVGLWGGRKGTSGCEMPSAPKLYSTLVKVGDTETRTLAIFHLADFDNFLLG